MEDYSDFGSLAERIDSLADRLDEGLSGSWHEGDVVQELRQISSTLRLSIARLRRIAESVESSAVRVKGLSVEDPAGFRDAHRYFGWKLFEACHDLRTLAFIPVEKRYFIVEKYVGSPDSLTRDFRMALFVTVFDESETLGDSLGRVVKIFNFPWDEEQLESFNSSLEREDSEPPDWGSYPGEPPSSVGCVLERDSTRKTLYQMFAFFLVTKDYCLDSSMTAKEVR